jgi:phytanoyl-CoA hydroxylase
MKSEIEQFARTGFLVIDRLLTAEECRSFLDRNRAFYADGKWSNLDTHLKSDCFDGVIRHPRVREIAEALLGGPVDCAQTLVFAKPPGSKGIAMHQESYYVETDPPKLLTCWVTFDDSDSENGGLCVIPGSHRDGLHAVHEPRDAEEHVKMRNDFPYHDRTGRRWTKTIIAGEIDPLPAGDQVIPVPAGGAVFFDGHTIHGSYRNRSRSRSRHAFSAQFIRRGTWIFREDIQALPV